MHFGKILNNTIMIARVHILDSIYYKCVPL